MFPVNVGDLRIDRVEELGGIRLPIDILLDSLSPDAILAERDRIPANCYDFGTNEAILTLQGWIVRTAHHIVLIDSCAGNDKPRANAHWIDRLNTPWLEQLARHGLSVDQIDYVMCTHLHADHVGWNTRLIDRRWVPTFPNAKYVFGRREYHHWMSKAANGDDEDQRQVLKDSVLPCVQAGAVVLVDDGFVLDDSLWVEAAPGHTAGHVLVRAKSRDHTALFIGDIMHTPLQVVFPDTNHAMCEIPEQSRKTRRRVLMEAAEHRHLVVPAHFPAPYLGRVKADRDGLGWIEMSHPSE